ncbi:protein Exd1 homolog [Contarinia nasturtii]|uniref:protein Exd1 homolog n=1 Tax=Contarinia nasturtii TaxID=265458 RepID=UPI0012D3AB37|nr:protein Exd1 homolog [Contarinia nasturtii]
MAKHVLEAGDKVKIELYNGRDIHAEFVSENENGFTVKKSKDLISGKERKFNQNFYHSEVKSIVKIHVPTTQHEVPSESNNKPRCERNGSIAKKKFSQIEIATIQNMARETVHIAQHDERYHSSIDDLKRQSIITVNSENSFGRLDTKRPLLTLTTPSKVYIFDMLRLGQMKKEFKEIFSSDLPRKIVHSSAELADYLLHKETCTINNVFDTLMVHFNLEKKHEHINLQKCYEKYFELPDDFILSKFDYNIRPLSKESLVRAALNSIMLMKLYWHMNDILMKPFYIASKQFSETYSSVDHQVDLVLHVNGRVYPGVENIELNAIEQLDNELELIQLN